ncbi:serine protease [Chroococcidiopsis sp. CCNUC1]|uniref:trypsin-like serine peptidase n=1 Tax=Chroococcidiopsis sp. CCNUC1 TaxID=2653189 RepID=UPI00202103F1|nr:trypsin-like peptidase domain-containing protein [Chroococcidiopsis sp. CCNUC1]URD48947.1 trypsin-like peptidase domain-containing protein [Chroococcidiopsis sp. CCNUC1]
MTKNRRLTATILSLGSCLGAIASTLQPSSAAVIGQDDRITPTYEQLTNSVLGAVGRLALQKADGSFGHCTFTVVGRNIGLTNAHCLLDEKGAPIQIKAAIAAQHSDRALAVTNVDVYWTGRDTAPVGIEDVPGDWAIVRFTTNLGELTGWLGNTDWNPNDINTAGQTVVGLTAGYVGYPQDWPTDARFQPGNVRGYTPALHYGCTIHNVEGGILLHDCDTTGGTSGSSLFTAVSQTDFRTIGLHSGEYPVQNPYINLAVPLERFMPAVLKLRQTGAASDTVVPRP